MTIAIPRKNGRAVEPKVIRVAAYARISVADREVTQFSSVEAQVEAITAYVQSQKALGWALVGEPYIDDGFSGATTDRPALSQLLDDAAGGGIDLVIVHRFDRFSRSQRDFLNLLHVLEGQGVSFASVSQQLDTSTPMGRCMLNMMTSFAQMEREVIAERTRDKIVASRRRGMWTGGRLVLGYDVVDKKLVVNEAEAEQVRGIYDLYLALKSLLAVAEELNRREWTTKSWTNKSDALVVGSAFDKGKVRSLISNPLYLGKTRCGDELHDGLHDAIVPDEIWDAVQAQLKKNAGKKTGPKKSKYNAMLAGLVRCGACGSAMTPQHTTKGTRRYLYYVCLKVQKEGARACRGSRIAAGKLESFVVERIRELGRDPDVLEATLKADRGARDARRPELEAKAKKLGKERARLDQERRNLVGAVAKGKSDPGLLQELGEVTVKLDTVTATNEKVSRELAAFCGELDPTALREALADFDAVWAELFPKERARVMGLLLQEVCFDGPNGEVGIAFRPGGPKALLEDAVGDAE